MKKIGNGGNISRQKQFCTFRIAQSLFGVNLGDVKEVRTPDRFTPVFHAPDEVRGVVNVRGQIHLVIDMRVLLGFESAEIGKLSRIVLFKPHVGESFGVLVDSVGDVVETDAGGIENMGERNTGLKEFRDLIEGNYKLEDSILIILDSTMLLDKIEKFNSGTERSNSP